MARFLLFSFLSLRLLLLVIASIGCRSNGTVLVPCYAAPNITCGNSDYDPGQNVFCKEEPCRYVLVDNSYNINWDII